MTTQKDALARLYFRLFQAGFDASEAQALHGIAMTLSRWDEAECNGDIQRDEETGKPYRYYGCSYGAANAIINKYPCADREAGAMKRLVELLTSHPEFTFYHQRDPRGCSLYLVKPEDIPVGSSLDSCYPTFGIAIF